MICNLQYGPRRRLTSLENDFYLNEELLQMNDVRWKQTSRFEIVAKSFARLIHNLTQAKVLNF